MELVVIDCHAVADLIAWGPIQLTFEILTKILTKNIMKILMKILTK